MSRYAHIDLETFFRTLLKTAGVYRYVEDPSTEILIACYAFGDEPVNAWIPDQLLPRELRQRITEYVFLQGGLCHIGYKIPERLHWHASQGGFFVAHNAAFERVVLNGKPGKTINFPHTQRSQWFCTMAKAAEAGLPHDLGGCAKALHTPHQKDENGRADMLRLSKPRKPSKNNPLTRWLPTEVPDKFFNLYTYCIDDVLTERDIDVNVKDLTKKERKLYLLDQKINDRGWRATHDGALKWVDGSLDTDWGANRAKIGTYSVRYKERPKTRGIGILAKLTVWGTGSFKTVSLTINGQRRVLLPSFSKGGTSGEEKAFFELRFSKPIELVELRFDVLDGYLSLYEILMLE